MTWEMGTDRRRFPRANFSCIVRIRHKGSVEAFQTTTENIGCGGVCVILPKGLSVFSPVEIELDIENGLGRIISDGRIVWVVHKSEISQSARESFDTGIEFVELKEKDRLRIEKIVEECLKKSIS